MNRVLECMVTEKGLTAVIFQPHQSMGMVALVVLGNGLSNADQTLEARISGKGMDKIETQMEDAADQKT